MSVQIALKNAVEINHRLSTLASLARLGMMFRLSALIVRGSEMNFRKSIEKLKPSKTFSSLDILLTIFFVDANRQAR